MFYIKKSTLIVASIICFFLASCLDEVKVPLRQETEKMIIEGLITNDIQHQFLRLSLTTQFGNANTVEPIQGAFVEIQSKTTGNVVFRPSPAELGVYKPNIRNFVGKIGESYNIYIKLPDGREFKSIPQVLPNPVIIEKLTTKFIEKPTFGFQTFVDFKDPIEGENYYRWTALGYHQRKSRGVPVGIGTAVCCDRCWVLKEEKGINLFSDALTNGSMIKDRPVFFSPFYVLGKHLIEVQQFTISRQTYQFWNKYKDQQQRTGSIFDPLPAPLLGNVVNINDPQDIALGYFEVSGVARKRIEPLADTQGVIAFNFDNALYVPNGDCMVAFPYSVYIYRNPPNW